jgi:hypothetical protein
MSGDAERLKKQKSNRYASQGVTTPYVCRQGGLFEKKFDSSYNNFFSVWEH